MLVFFNNLQTFQWSIQSCLNRQYCEYSHLRIIDLEITRNFIEFITAYIQHLRYRIYFYIVLFHSSQSILNSLIYFFCFDVTEQKHNSPNGRDINQCLVSVEVHTRSMYNNNLPTHLVR